jgi:LmbE family N-acetylglucosaminyl deacetylase
MRKPCLYVIVFGCSLAGGVAGARAVEPATPAEVLRELRGFHQMGSVLYIAAHPDDENTQLITYLARGRNYRTAYLSVTRGDGGQNVLGPEFDEELGVIRTQELLAARRLDGGRQFFTRAIDFGFSKDSRETLNIWDRQQVLSDMVRVVRSFQPDVMIARFSPQPGNNHGHHTASAVLAIEAFKLAGDTNAFPDQLRELPAWQPKRLLQNGRGFGRSGTAAANETTLSLETGGNDPVTGESFGDIAGRSRSMHKTQGFGNFSGGGRGGRQETFQLLAGQAATNDILEGVDTTWARMPGGEEIGHMAEKVIAGFDTNNPASSVPALLELRARLTALAGANSGGSSTGAGSRSSSLLLKEKCQQLDRILQACLGLSVQTTVPQAEIVPGETLKMHHMASVRADVPVQWLAVRYPSISQELKKTIELRPNQPVVREASETVPLDTPLSQPYWLRQERTTGMFRVDDPTLIGMPENPPAFPVEQVFEVGGQTLVIPDEPVQVPADAARRAIPRRLDVVAPVALRFVPEVELFAPGSTRPVKVEVTAVRAGANGTLQLQTPAGWGAAPEFRPFHLSAVGDKAVLEFSVTAPGKAARSRLQASALINGAKFVSQRIEIHYPHIPPQLLQPPARLEAVSLDLAIRGHEVGYVPGAGDRTAEALEQMGYKVTVLTGADLTPERLRGLDAVVIGIRAFNVRTDLAPQLPALFAFVEQGGTVVEQYNRPNDSKTSKLTPFELKLSNERVTDETAPMTFLVPDHPALNTPNKITSADFEGWVQERGNYFPSQWDEHFTPLLGCNDPGESPLKGSLLVAQYGRGYFVYTGLAMFRQLPAGVPGAYRLFANLVSLGHTTASPPAQEAK